MDLVELTDFLIKKLVTDPDTVRVQEFPTESEDLIQIEALVSKDDIASVIGKSGKIINSIRTIVQATASLNGDKKVRINIDSY